MCAEQSAGDGRSHERCPLWPQRMSLSMTESTREGMEVASTQLGCGLQIVVETLHVIDGVMREFETGISYHILPTTVTNGKTTKLHGHILLIRVAVPVVTLMKHLFQHSTPIPFSSSHPKPSIHWLLMARIPYDGFLLCEYWSHHAAVQCCSRSVPDLVLLV